MNVEAIPQELRELPQWVVWRTEQRQGKATKVPYRTDSRRASTTDPTTWTTFQDAVETAMIGEADGIGFVFSAEDPYVGVDLDTFDADAAAVVSALSSYTERSVSGRGAHVIVRASLNGTRRRRKGPVEVYADGRYFVVTGDHITGTPATIEERQAQLEEVLAHVFPKPRPGASAPPPTTALDLDDQALLELARKARNGAGFERLWAGSSASYDSPSEADLALCGMIAFYAGPDVARIDGLFRRSGLMREKWDTRRGEATYGEQTIARALEGKTEFYARSNLQRSATVAPEPEPSLEGELQQDTSPHSWIPVRLTVAGATPPEPPTISGIAYPGRVHVWSGEPEALKSLTTLVVAVPVIRGGGCVAYLDLESNGERETLSRLHALGLTDEEVDAGFLYLAPSEPLTDPAILADVEELLVDRRPALVTVDSYTASLALHGCDPDRGVDVERHAQAVLRPLRAGGSAIVLLDHLTKDREKRGRYSIGSERKLGIADVHLGFEVVSPFGRGRRGLVHLHVHKDRPAHLPRPRAGEIEFTSERATGAIGFAIRLATDAGEGGSGSFRPTVLMERVSRYLELQSEPASRTKVETTVKGNVPYLRVAMDCLVAEGYAEEVLGSSPGRPLVSLRAFREHDFEPTPSTTPSMEDDGTPSNPVHEPVQEELA